MNKTFLCAFATLLPFCAIIPAYAATNDDAFNDCQQELSQDSDTLTSEAWKNSPLPPEIQNLVAPDLYGDVIIRWISHKNPNHTVSFVVLERDPEPQPADDPDGFDVILQTGQRASITTLVAANGFAFSKTATSGVNGLFFCTHGDISNEWTWSGKTWK
ncbi:MAG: hypothetical protein KGH91_07910 [Rhodospirillales bacterium]|nr:hypothetical protein [Rhodospirillales bacterium]